MENITEKTFVKITNKQIKIYWGQTLEVIRRDKDIVQCVTGVNGEFYLFHVSDTKPAQSPS